MVFQFGGDAVTFMTEVRPAPASAGRVLIVDGESSMRDLLRRNLTLEGFDVAESLTGAEALTRLEQETFDLVLLDLVLPEIDGLTLCRAMRARGQNRQTPVMIVTARNSEADRVLGLESGADDYLAKPFGVRELMARLRAVLRRVPRVSAGVPSPASGDLAIDPARREVTVRGELVDLTRQEFDLLSLLASHPGIVFSRNALLARVWGSERDVTERTVDAAVSRLRRKIERNPDAPELVRTAWGVGYRFHAG
jgi:two-component system, OmpR family, response regulator